MSGETTNGACGVELGDELFVAELRKLRHRLGLVTLRRDARDEADFGSHPGERRAFPARAVDGAVAVDIEVRHARQADEFLLAGGERRALGRETVVINPVAAPVRGERRVVPRGGNSRLIDPTAAATGTATVIRKRLDDFVAKVFEEARIAMLRQTAEVMQPNVPAAAVVGIVAREQIEQRTHSGFENVPRAVRPDLQARAVRTHPHHAAAAHLDFATVRAGRFHESEIANRRVEPAIDAQFDSVRRVIRRTILEGPADAGDERLLFVRHAVAIVIDEHADVRRVQQIKAVLIPDEPARRIDVRDERFHFVRATIAVGVAHAQHAAELRLAIDRSVAIAGDVERAIGRGGDEHRIIHRGRGREDGGLKFIRHLHVLDQLLGLLRHDGGKRGEFLGGGLAILGGKLGGDGGRHCGERQQPGDGTDGFQDR